MYSALAQHWSLDQTVTFLNHGSFGACPRAILELQQRLRDQMESDPIQFLSRDYQGLLDASRTILANYIHAEPECVVFVHNVTEAVNAVFRSRRFEPGDEILVTNHTYGACRNVADYVAKMTGARVVQAPVPFPLRGEDEIVEAVMRHVTPRTRIAMLDHVTSPTAIVFPMKKLVQALDAKGVDTFVDGAHGLGMLTLNMKEIGAAYYGGNCHKWLCAPKGAGFLYVRPDKLDGLQPACISHGYAAPRGDRNAFQSGFDWIGTIDPTPWLCVGESIRWCDSLMPGGIGALIRHNHDLVVRGRQILCETLKVEAPCPESLLGSTATVPVPLGANHTAAMEASTPPDIGGMLFERYRIEVPCHAWPAMPQFWVRISAQAYNSEEQYKYLAWALDEILAACAA
jgi:isopenicillin-N epimerase